MARVKRTTRKPASPAADRIEGPNTGKKVRQVGAQTGLESHALSGTHGARAGSVREVGPTDIRNSSDRRSDSVKRVGSANYEDAAAAGQLVPSYSRQEGSVKEVGPRPTGWGTLNRRSGPNLKAKDGRPLTTRRIISGTPLLKSGVGRAHDWSKAAGQPGSIRGGNSKVRVAGATSGSLLVSGRRRKFAVEPEGEEQVTPSGPAIIPGHTGE